MGTGKHLEQIAAHENPKGDKERYLQMEQR